MDNKYYKNTFVKTPTIYQMEGTECGAASLAMILAYHGRNIPLEQLRIDCGVGRDGSSIINIKKAASKHGMEAKSFMYSAENLHTMPVPGILYWKFSHYVVFEGYKNGYYYINDPSKGRRKLTFEEIKSDFSRVVVEFTKNGEFVRIKRKNQMLREMFERISLDKKAFSSIILIGLILVVPSVLIPILSQVFVDRVIAGRDIAWAGVVIAAIIGALLFQLIFNIIRMKTLVALQAKAKLVFAYGFLSHMFKLPVNFFEQRLPGALTHRVDNNNRVSQFSTGDFAKTVLDIFIAAFFLIIMLLYSPVLTLIGVTGVAINLVFGQIFSKKLDSMAQKAQNEQQKLKGNLYVATGSLETVKASGVERIYLSTILSSYADASNSIQGVNRTAEILMAVPQAITKIFEAMTLMFGGYLVIKGEITAGVLVAFSQLLTSFITPMNTLIGFFSEIKLVKADLTCVNDVMNYQISPRFENVEDKDDVERLVGEVEFKNVSFGYTPLEAPLIENISFTIKPGRTLALVGSSGSGKSTIGKLANGLLIPWGGEILYDGHPVERIQNHVFSYYVCMAAQKISMFSGSIRDNITMWNENISDERVMNAAKDACIHKTITKLPGAYSAMMSEGGTNFSEGEKQRIEIARMLATNPSIVILDEATSALDPIVEEQVITNIKKRGCTCIIIAHRLSTIRDCDEIIVLNRGKIVQRGTHAEMKDVEGTYKDLISME